MESAHLSLSFPEMLNMGRNGSPSPPTMIIQYYMPEFLPPDGKHFQHF